MTGRAVRQLRALVGPADPVRDAPPLTNARHRDQLLRTILSQQPLPGRTWVRRRRVIVAATAAAMTAAVGVGVAIVVIGGSSPPAYAATPPPLAFDRAAGRVPAAERLHQLAATAERTPDTGSTNRSIEHLYIAGWSLYSLVDGRRTNSAVVPVQQQSWRRADDSGRIEQRYAAPIFASDAHRAAWWEEGSPGADTGWRTVDYPPGLFPGRWRGRPPADAAALAAWLRHGAPGAADGSAGLTAVADLLRERVLTGAERAVVLRFLAQIPGLAAAGDVVDRAGRAGEAFTLRSDSSGLPTDYTVIVDPDDGRVLAFEQMLTTSAGRLNVRVPAVVGYQTYLTAEQVRAVG